MISTLIRILSFVVMLFSVPYTAQCAAAVIAYDNIDPNRVGGGGGSYVGNFVYGEAKVAQRFTAGTSGQLTKLDMTLAFTPAEHNVDDVTLSIVTDERGKPGTTNLWSERFIDKTERSFLNNPYPSPSSYNVTDGLSLHRGSTYWVVATATSKGKNPYIWWYEATGNVGTTALYYIKSTGPYPTGEWIINLDLMDHEHGLRVTIIPEPAAAALMLAASATLLAVRRRTSL